MKEKISKIIVLVISILIVVIPIYKSVILWALELINPEIGMKTATILVLLLFLIYVLYRYLYKILELFKTKKIIKSILMLTIMLIFILFVILTQNVMGYNFRIVIYNIIAVIGVIILPLITIGIVTLNNNISKKSKIIKTIILILLTIFIYAMNLQAIQVLAKASVEKMKNNEIQEIIKTREEENNESSKKTINKLNPYIQKMNKMEYVNRDDIIYVLRILENCKDTIKINYTDNTILNIKLEQDTSKLGWKEHIERELEGNYYKIKVDYDNEKMLLGNIIKNIYVEIERYDEKIEMNKEKNEEIIKGQLRKDIIQNIKSEYKDENSINYTFENEIKINRNLNNKELNNLKVLFIYDKQTNNFIPYTEDSSNYEKIKSYKIYGEGMTLTLEDDVLINKSDYTLRINRYDSNYNVLKTSTYSYKYEPIVTKLTNGKNTVLEIKFDNTYQLKDLKNIEIIF